MNYHKRFKNPSALSNPADIFVILRLYSPLTGASECVPTMVKLLLDLFIECVGQPFEAIARLGCSCLRYVICEI